MLRKSCFCLTCLSAMILLTRAKIITFKHQQMSNGSDRCLHKLTWLRRKLLMLPNQQFWAQSSLYLGLTWQQEAGFTGLIFACSWSNMSCVNPLNQSFKQWFPNAVLLGESSYSTGFHGNHTLAFQFAHTGHFFSRCSTPVRLLNNTNVQSTNQTAAAQCVYPCWDGHTDLLELAGGELQ